MDEQTFAAAVRQMEETLYRVAAGLLWDDAKAAEAIGTCIPEAWQRRAKWHEKSELERWLLRRLIRRCRSIPRGEVHMAAATDPQVRQCLRSMPARYRLPLLLQDGLPVPEIARVLHLTIRETEKRIRKARLLLERALGEEVN